jgi:transposase
MKLVQKMDKERSNNRRWFFVFSIARTWKQENGESIKDFVKNLAYSFYKRTWIKHLTDKNRRKTFWIYGKTINLNHIGEVTVVLSKTRRNAGPKNTKIIVTNLPNVTAREVISIYQRRWSVEIIFKELKSGLGLGEHQVTKKEHRIKNSIGISIISYLFLLIACKDQINQGRSWGIFKLQDIFRIKVITHQSNHSMNLQIKKLLKAA